MLRDFALKDGRIVVKQTGAEILLNSEFIREFARGASFAAEVKAITTARFARAQFSAGRHPRTRICFAPAMPYPWYAIWPVSQLAGMDIVRSPAEADILFYFEDSEFADKLPMQTAGKPVLNGTCLDIRKSTVGRHFEDVFGYSLDVDPMTHSGLALQKSERNGVHDGQILPCPYYTPRKGYVYQRLIDNTEDGRIYTDIRTPIVAGRIPVVYLKRRTSVERFSNDNFRVELTHAAAQFSAEEENKIVAFAAAMNLDFGGLDVLRDRKDGRIYVVDVNKTDMGPPTALPHHDKHMAMNALAKAFRDFVAGQLRTDKAA